MFILTYYYSRYGLLVGPIAASNLEELEEQVN